jgi:hypothetical protein
MGRQKEFVTEPTKDNPTDKERESLKRTQELGKVFDPPWPLNIISRIAWRISHPNEKI